MEYVISLGGSVIFPKNIDTIYLRKFKKVVLNFIKKRGNKLMIICGGGRMSRDYQKAAGKIAKLNLEDVDWLGIHSTRLNAHLLRTIFRGYAYKRVLKDPTEKLRLKEKILIAAGWKPGWSTDYDAVLLAKNFGVNTVINISNINYVYDKDPKRYNNAKKIKNISWKGYRKISGNEWKAGLNAPFDPVAAKEAEKSKLRIIIIGKNLKNFEDLLNNRKFEGTIIE